MGNTVVEKRAKAVKDREVSLAAHPLFEGISPQERDRAIGACIRKQYRRGDRVFSTGDPPEFLYLIEAGHVQLVALEESGSERILHIYRPGDIFGMILFSVERRPFDAVAMDEARIAIMSRATFLEFERTSPTWALNFIRLLSDQLFIASRDLAALSRTWTRPRLVHLLLKLADNVGTETPQGTVITVPVTHEALANMIGASRVRVTSALSQMRREGLVSKQGRQLVVRIEGLRALAKCLFGSGS
jgi:CRP/FNR family transcriptional regulator